VSIPTNVSLPNPLPHLFEFVPKEEEALGERVRRVLGPTPPPTSISVEIGVPFRCILEAAKEADAIVMATHGRTGLRHLVMGSVAERVLRLSPIPVLTVHAKPSAGTTGRGSSPAAA
jgi:nucleotide-binding universal stress UspA family protein